MSRKLVSLIQDNNRLSAKHKRTLCAYAARANNDGTNIFASKEKIGEKYTLSRSTIYHNTPDLVRARILVQATSHTCKVPTCNKSGTHYWGQQGKYTVVYNINLPALENDETYLLLNQLKVPLPKQLNLFVQNRQKVGLPKLDATQSLEPTPVSLSTKDSSVLADGIDLLTNGRTCESSQNQNLLEDRSSLPESKATPKPGQDEPLLVNGYPQRNPRTADEWKSMPYATCEMFLMDAVSPNKNDAMIARDIPIYEAIVRKYESAWDSGALEQMVKWNHVHESGKFRIRTAQQFMNALDGITLVNNYDDHEFTMCTKCKAAGLQHYQIVRERVAMAEANAQDAALAAKAVAGMSGGVKDAYRSGGFEHEDAE